MILFDVCHQGSERIKQIAITILKVKRIHLLDLSQLALFAESFITGQVYVNNQCDVGVNSCVYFPITHTRNLGHEI